MIITHIQFFSTGFVDGTAVVCGGEDSEGLIHSLCYQLDPVFMLWLPYVELSEGRSFAGATVVEGCLMLAGGKTQEGPTSSVEMVGQGCGELGLEVMFCFLDKCFVLYF